MKNLFVLSLIFVTVGGASVFAQGNDVPVSKNNPGNTNKEGVAFTPAIYFVKARTLPKNKTAVRSYYVKPFVSEMYNSAQEKMVQLPDTMDVTLNTLTVFGSYGITDAVTVGMNAKFLFNRITIGSAVKKGYGVGDIEALLKIGFLRTKPLRLSFAVNISFPTGSVVETNTTLPLGTDSFDYSFRLLSDFKIGKTLLTGAFFYTLNGRALTSGINYGDGIRFIITEAIPLPYGFALEATVNYEHAFSDTLDGLQVPYTQNDFLSLALGVQYSITKNVFAQVLYEYAPVAIDSFARTHTVKAGLSLNL